MKTHLDDEIKRDEWSVPSMKVDVELIATYFTNTLGATIAEVTQASTHSNMSHGPILKRDCAIYKVMKAKPELKEWIKGLQTNHKVYGRPAEDGNREEENEEEDVDGGGEGGDLLEVEEMDLIALEEEELAIVPVLDTTLAEARQRAKDYMARTKAKPHRGEDEDTFADRIAKIMFSGNADRKTRSQMKTNHRVGETTMTTEEVGAAAEARKRYSEITGTKKRRPWKIVEEVVGKTVGRFFKCLYHDVGYGGQDYEDTHDESYLRQFEGFMEDYEAVSVALPPPLSVI
jgi:hypothetical protein